MLLPLTLTQPVLEVAWILHDMMVCIFSSENNLQYKHFQKERLGLDIIPHLEDGLWLVGPFSKF